MPFRLQFDRGLIPSFAARYPEEEDEEVEHVIAPQVKSRGYMTVPDFLALCKWKTRRSKSRCEKNSEDVVREATRFALATNVEELRIGVLTLLDGVGWPTASVILHLCHHDPYPILDYRALWSLGTDLATQYTFGFWWSYTAYCRELAQQSRVSMRVLDRALWQYSKENQP